MKIEYYTGTDTIYIDLKETPSVESAEISLGVVVDYDEQGDATGIEIDNAKERINLSKIETKSLTLKDLLFA